MNMMKPSTPTSRLRRKRGRSMLTPTKTPTKPRKKLFIDIEQEIKVQIPWTKPEEECLLHYIQSSERMQTGKWPKGTSEFWQDAAKLLAEESADGTIRTGDACRRKGVIGANCLLRTNIHTRREKSDDELHQTATTCLDTLLKRQGCAIPTNFTQIVVKALKKLQDGKEPDILTGLARALGETNKAGKPKLPLNKMPYVMFKYHIQYVNADYIAVPCPTEYLLWIETMYTQFGGRFLRLFRGPYLHNVDMQEWHPSKARINVACVGRRTITDKMNKDTRFTTTTDIQVEAIKELAKANQGERYWILSDATDVKVCLQESKRQVWNGDVDMNDGKLEEMKEAYDKERSDIVRLTSGNTGMGERRRLLENEIERLENLDEFLKDGIVSSTAAFNEKLEKKKTTEDTLMRYCWNMTEWEIIWDQTQDIKKQLLEMQAQSQKGISIIGSLEEIGEDLLLLHMNTYKKKRKPADHVLVFFIANEERKGQPYGIPVRFLACNTITDQKHRELVDQIKEELLQHGLKAIGSVTDGEYNSSCYKSYDGQDTSIFGIIQDVKADAAGLNKRQLMGMILPRQQRGPNGKLQPIIDNSFVPQDVLEYVFQVMLKDPEFDPDDLVDKLKMQLLPGDFKPSTWKEGVEDTLLQGLRTIIATYMYRERLQKSKAAGRDLTRYAYIPAFDSSTGDYFHIRGDHLHLVRRIGTHTRNGGNGLQMEGFAEILQDKEAGLTEAALRGHDKQSSVDAEALLSYRVAEALGRRGYQKEAEYVKVIAQWHEAADGRAVGRDLNKTDLTEEEEKEERAKCQDRRKMYNDEMLKYIIKEWMPWQGQVCDYSLVDINKPIKGILGWSRETIIEVITNIESQEFRRRQISSHGLPPEHPRAGTTDIVEGGFAQARSAIGGDSFTLKQFRTYWRSNCRELCKMLDPNLPFHYTWPTNRVTDGDGVFDSPVGGNPLRLHTIRTKARRNTAVFTAARGALAVHHQSSMRKTWYLKPSPLPSVPGRKFPLQAKI